MKVLRLCWLGIPAREYEPMVRLLRDTMELRVGARGAYDDGVVTSQRGSCSGLRAGRPVLRVLRQACERPRCLVRGRGSPHGACRTRGGRDRDSRRHRAGQHLGVAELSERRTATSTSSRAAVELPRPAGASARRRPRGRRVARAARARRGGRRPRRRCSRAAGSCRRPRVTTAISASRGRPSSRTAEPAIAWSGATAKSTRSSLVW